MERRRGKQRIASPHLPPISQPNVCARKQIVSAFHRRFPKTFTPALISLLSTAIAPPSRSALAALTPEQREKEDSARVTRQRPVLRICAELALVGIIRDGPEKSGGEWIMKAVKDLVGTFLHCILTIIDTSCAAFK